MIIFYPFYPDDRAFTKDEFIIDIPFQGFMSICCNYEIKESKAFLFEKSLGEFNTEGSLDFSTLNIESIQQDIVVTYKTSLGESETKYFKNN